MIQIKNINTPDKNLQLIQDATNKAVTDLQGLPLVGGALISNVSLDSALSTNSIAHRLGYTPSQWLILDQDAQSAIWRTNWDSQFLYLKCSADVNVKLWVK